MGKEVPEFGRGEFSVKGSYSIIQTDPIAVGGTRQLLMDD